MTAKEDQVREACQRAIETGEPVELRDEDGNVCAVISAPNKPLDPGWCCQEHAQDLQRQVTELQAEIAALKSGGDLAHLRRIVGDVLPVEHVDPALLTVRFEDGTRLSFLGNDGRLLGVVLQRENVPELRMDARPTPPRPQFRSALARGLPVPPWIHVTPEPSACIVCGGDLLPTLRVDTSTKNINPVGVCMGCLQAVLVAEAFRS